MFQDLLVGETAPPRRERTRRACSYYGLQGPHTATLHGSPPSGVGTIAQGAVALGHWRRLPVKCAAERLRLSSTIRWWAVGPRGVRTLSERMRRKTCAWRQGSARAPQSAAIALGQVVEVCGSALCARTEGSFVARAVTFDQLTGSRARRLEEDLCHYKGFGFVWSKICDCVVNC